MPQPTLPRTKRQKFKDLPIIAIFGFLSLVAYLIYSLTRPESKSQVKANPRPYRFKPAVSGLPPLSCLLIRRSPKTPAEVSVDEAPRQPKDVSEKKAHMPVSASGVELLPVPAILPQILAASLPGPSAASPTPPTRVRDQPVPVIRAHSFQEFARHKRIWLVSLTLICLGILAIAIYILNVSLWDNRPLPIPAGMDSWACFIPQFCNLRFPPVALLAFTGVIFVIVLFGGLVRRLPNPPGLTDILTRPVTLKDRRTIFKNWRWLFMGLWLTLSAYIIWGSFAGQPVPVWVWFINLASFMGAVRYLAPAKSDWSINTRWNLIYLGGLAGLLIGLAGCVSAHPVPLVLGGVLASLGLGSVFAKRWRHWSVPERAERVLIPLIMVAAFALMIHGYREWNWAVSEDSPSPWDYYELAMQYATGILAWPNVNTTGVYGGTAALSSAFQAVCLVVFGVDAFAWRISNVLLLTFAIPAFYYFARQFLNRRGALLMICLYASGHFLLSYNKTGYHTLQIIAIFAFTLAALAWGTRHGSLLGFAFAGLFLGLGFNTYGVARIYLWVAAMWLLFYCFPVDWRARRLKWDRVLVWGVLGLAFILTALPISANPASWQEQLSRTVFVQSDVAHNTTEGLAQISTNILYGATSFLTSSANTTFVFGAHTDPISAASIVLALASLIAGWKNLRRARLFLLSLIGGLVIFVSGLETYSYPSTNWMLALIPLYALLAALGLIYLGHIIQLTALGINRLAWVRRASTSVVSLVLTTGLLAVLNFWISNELGPSKLSQPPQSFIIQSAMLTEGQAGEGARVIAIIDSTNQYLYLSDKLNPLLPMMYQAYHIPLDRLTIISPVDAYTDPSFCNVGNQPVVIIMDYYNQYAQRIAARIQDCWPNAAGHIIKDMTDRPHYYRFVNSQAQALVRPLPGYWTEMPIPSVKVSNLQPDSRGVWEVKEPLGIATSSDGSVAVIEGATHSVIVFDQQGQAVKSLTGMFTYPSALGYATTHHELVVLDAGASTPLTWFDADFQISQQGGNLSFPRGMFVAPDDSLYIADTGFQRIVHLSPAAEVLDEYLAPGQFGQPTSVAVSADGWVAVGDPTIGKIFTLNPAGVIQNEYVISLGGTTVEKPGLLWLSDDELLYTDPNAGRVILVQGQKILQEWTGFARPNGLALGRNNQALVLEFDKNRVTTIDLSKYANAD